MLLHRFGEGAENDAQFSELFAEGGRDRDAIEDRIDGNAGQSLLFIEGDPQFLEGFEQFGIHLVEAIDRLLRLGSAVVDDLLVIDGIAFNLRPARIFHVDPVPVRLEAILEQPLRLTLSARDLLYRRFVQPWRQRIRLHIGDKTELVLAIRELL